MVSERILTLLDDYVFEDTLLTCWNSHESGDLNSKMLRLNFRGIVYNKNRCYAYHIQLDMLLVWSFFSDKFLQVLIDLSRSAVAQS